MLSCSGRKRCPQCGQSKVAAEEFNKNRSSKDGYGSYCRACARKRERTWRKANPQEWEARRKMLEERRVRLRTVDPFVYAETMRLRAALRKDRSRPLYAALTLEQWLQVRDAFGQRCCYCGAQSSLGMEHLTPLSRGGRTVFGNVAPACAGCNSVKQGRLAEEFRPDIAGDIRRIAALVSVANARAIVSPLQMASGSGAAGGAGP